jgi:hypothetical protein
MSVPVLLVAPAEVARWADFCQHRSETEEWPADGFHLYGADGNLRWTDGDARLPMALFSGFSRGVDVVLYVNSTTPYPFQTDAEERAAA